MKYLTLDIGATAIKSALFNCEGQIERSDECPSNGNRGAQTLLQAAFSLIERYRDYDGVGIACTGQVDARTGRIVYANRNVEGFTGTELGSLMEARLKVPVTVDNDVNAAALGEGAFGAARGQRDFICVSYGTGVGGAIVIEGKVYGGQSGVAGEVGHIITHPGGRECACGGHGCYEQYASVTALLRDVRRDFPEIHTGRELFAALKTRPELQPPVERWIDEIACGLVTLTHIFNPSLFVLCGGVMAQPCVLDRLTQVYIPQIMASYQTVQLTAAQLGNLAGAYGAFTRIRDKLTGQGRPTL